MRAYVIAKVEGSIGNAAGDGNPPFQYSLTATEVAATDGTNGWSYSAFSNDPPLQPAVAFVPLGSNQNQFTSAIVTSIINLILANAGQPSWTISPTDVFLQGFIAG